MLWFPYEIPTVGDPLHWFRNCRAFGNRAYLAPPRSATKAPDNVMRTARSDGVCKSTATSMTSETGMTRNGNINYRHGENCSNLSHPTIADLPDAITMQSPSEICCKTSKEGRSMQHEEVKLIWGACMSSSLITFLVQSLTFLEGFPIVNIT